MSKPIEEQTVEKKPWDAAVVDAKRIYEKFITSSIQSLLNSAACDAYYQGKRDGIAEVTARVCKQVGLDNE